MFQCVFLDQLILILWYRDAPIFQRALQYAIKKKCGFKFSFFADTSINFLSVCELVN